MCNSSWVKCVAAAFCLVNAACDNDKASRQPVAADNTANNKVDRETNAKTPLDQSESSPDIMITTEIRRQVMKIENLSVNGQNCKIITDKGVVTLRGPVNNPVEKDSIGTIAKNVAGVVRVDNELEIKTP